MTLQTQHTANAPATLTDEQRQRVSDALKNAQSENTRRNYAGQHRKFRAWCEREGQSALPASPEVVAAYAAELVAEGKSMSTIRLAVSAIIDVHNRRVDLEWPVNAGVSVTLRGSARQLALARSVDEEALAAVRATVFTLFTRTRSRRSPADRLLPAVLAGSPWALDGAVSVQTFLSDQAAAIGCITELVLAGKCPDVFVYVTTWLAAPLRIVR